MIGLKSLHTSLKHLKNIVCAKLQVQKLLHKPPVKVQIVVLSKKFLKILLSI